jgi:hypothetical protein
MMKNIMGIVGAALLAIVTHSCNKAPNLAGSVSKNEIPTEFIQKETGRLIRSDGGFPVIPKDFQTKNPYAISNSDFKPFSVPRKTTYEKRKKDINTHQIRQALTSPNLPKASVGGNFSVFTPLNIESKAPVLAKPKDLFLPHLSPFPTNPDVPNVTTEWQPKPTLPRPGVETGTPVRGLW